MTSMKDIIQTYEERIKQKYEFLRPAWSSSEGFHLGLRDHAIPALSELLLVLHCPELTWAYPNLLPHLVQKGCLNAW